MATKLVNINVDINYDVYIGRPSKWGNPFTHLPSGYSLGQVVVDSRKIAIQKYKEYLLSNEELIKDIEELRDKTLGCFCHPLPCHGDVLIEILEKIK